MERHDGSHRIDANSVDRLCALIPALGATVQETLLPTPATGLTAGTYTVTISDNAGCDSIAEFVIDANQQGLP